jgi:uncharacterized protein
MNLISSIFNNTFQKSEESSQLFRVSRQGKKFDTKVLLICILACLSLVMIEYIGKEPGYRVFIGFLKNIRWNSFANFLNDKLDKSPEQQLNRLAYWVSCIMVFYLILPVVLVKAVFREKISDYGFQIGSAFKDYRIYIYMLLIMIPLVYLFSRTQSFQERYPFYNLKPGESLYPNFWTWQIMYFIQFIGVEFFFRGFMVHGLKKRFGFYSIIIMTIPYCMIHFGKPMPETIAAIFAGLILGTLSLKSNSIWLGIAIHYSVAITMDISALWQKGLIFH